MSDTTPLLRDEAIEKLISAVEDETVAELTISVDHGRYTASFATRHIEIEGADKPVLSDALNSLVEAVFGRD